MKKILSLVVLVPVGLALIVLSVANRQPVTLRLDPFNEAAPALALTWPFFAFLFGALLVGMLVGAAATWLGQGRHRAGERQQRAQARRWREEAEAQRRRADELAMQVAAGQSAAAGLPALPAGEPGRTVR